MPPKNKSNLWRVPIAFSHFGYGHLARTKDNRFHPGWDLNGPGGGNADLGNPVYSPGEGQVAYIHTRNKLRGFGNLLCLLIGQSSVPSLPPRLLVRLGHVQNIDSELRVGSIVQAGQQVAEVGNKSGGFYIGMTAHLHMDILAVNAPVLRAEELIVMSIYPTPAWSREEVSLLWVDPALVMETPLRGLERQP